MHEVIACPLCKRQLRVPDGVLGQAVKCPSCQSTFTAALPSVSPRRPDPEDTGDIYQLREDLDDPPRSSLLHLRSEEFDEEGDYYRDRERSRQQRRGHLDLGRPIPHRGASVLTLGILSLVFFFVPLMSWIMGGIALAMASQDLTTMARGRMDSSGMGITRGGQICGILGILLGCVWCCGISTLAFALG
jgi:predicted Zn finger-like uncharacterized protein